MEKRARSATSSASYRQTTPDQVQSGTTSISVTGKGDTVANLPFQTFDGNTWISGVSPTKEKWSHSLKNTNVPRENDPSGVSVKTECETISLEASMQTPKPGDSTNAVAMKGLKPTSAETNSSQTFAGEHALNILSGTSPQIVYMLPQVNTNIGAKNAEDSSFPQANTNVDNMEYQSKLKQAVTKAKAKKRVKASAQQQQQQQQKLTIANDNDTAFTNENASTRTATSTKADISTNSVIGSGLSAYKMQDGGEVRFLDQSDNAPFFIALPLTTNLQGSFNNGNNSEVNITPQQYYELLNAEYPEVRLNDIPDSNKINVGFSKQMGQTRPVQKISTRNEIIKDTRTQTGNNQTVVSSANCPEVAHIPASEVYPFDPVMREIPDISNITQYLVTRKVYEDSGLCRDILEAMWQMVDADLHWDALIFIGRYTVKAHKVVLASVCSLVHSKIISSEESMLKLWLPANLDHKVVQAFVKYLYHGNILITVGNVKDIYRLSVIFKMEALKKHVCDFCTTLALAHIVLNNSQDECVDDIQFEEPEIKINDVEIPNVPDEITNTTTELIENIDLEASEITIEFSKAADKKEEVVFDWTGIDENESNIPIRKRGRSRKGIANLNLASKTITNIDIPLPVDGIVGDEVSEVRSGVNVQTSNKEAPDSHVIEKKPETDISIIDLQIQQSDGHSQALNKTKAGSEEKHKGGKSTNKVLPDPFASGRFDESKLMEDCLSKPPSPVMVTRFRGKNRNILKAASKKKARLDEGINRTDKVSEDEKNKTKTEEISKKKKHEKTSSKRKSSQRKAAASPAKIVDSETENLTEKENRQVVSEIDQPIKPELKPLRTPLPILKKAKAKRSITEQEIPTKSEAIMRPPFKKRSKEISEMMKNVDKDSALPTDKSPKEDKTTVKKKKAERPRTKPETLSLPQTRQLLEKIAEIDEKGRNVDGERMFRCEFCGNEYVCMKRVLTHIVKTHDILLEDTVENITVLPKNLSPKQCDICGYVSKAKVPNIYYVHFHKYFRHGVTLPHGWSTHKCDLCLKEFFTKFQLKEHKLAHFEEVPFVCQHCGNGFKTRTCLNSHMFHKHSKVKNHACSECYKSFKTRTQLEVHLRTHSGRKPFACPHCTYRSTTRGNMRLHLTSRHKFEIDVIKNIMENLKATEQEIPMDDDGNIIKMKDSGFAVKLGTSDGQVLQIDPAGTAETHLMDTLAAVATSKGKDAIRGDLGCSVAIQMMQDQSIMSIGEASRSYNSHLRNRVYEFTDEKQNESPGDQVVQESELFAQNIYRPLQLTTTNSEDRQLINSGPLPVGIYKSHGVSISNHNEQSQVPNTGTEPGSEVAQSKMIVRNVLRRLEQRPVGDKFSLLKEALAQSPIPSFVSRSTAGAEIVEVAEAFLQENSMVLNSHPEELEGNFQNEYITSSRPQRCETTKDLESEPLQLVLRNTTDQNRQLSHAFAGDHPSLPYSVQAANKELTMSEIPTIIAEEIQHLEKIPESDQLSGKDQGHDMTSKTVSQQPTTEEHELMYDNYYQQNYQHAYH